MSEVAYIWCTGKDKNRDNGHLGSLLLNIQQLVTLHQHTQKCLFLNLTEYQPYLAELLQIFSVGLEVGPVISESKILCRMHSQRKRNLSVSSLIAQ